MFVEARLLEEQGPSGLTRQLERLLRVLSFDDVANIDGSGDRGGDLLAYRKGSPWVFQCKWKQSSPVPESAVDEIREALTFYNAHHGVLVTNTRLSRDALLRIENLSRSGLHLQHWDGKMLRAMAAAAPNPEPMILRDYQEEALTAGLVNLSESGRSLVFLATGLGKTVVAGEVVRRHMLNAPDSQVLVVAHTVDLVAQLERALWRHLPNAVPTTLSIEGSRPDYLPGVTCATLQSALTYAQNGFRPSLVVVDEAHHVGRDGQYADLLDILNESQQLGVTATPWRGDRYDITRRFGEPSYSLGIAQGMARGYLAEVNYRLFADNLDWDFIENTSQHSYTLKDLNARLFLPLRDEAIRDELLETWDRTRNPRAIVFCRSVEHAERMADLLSRVPQWKRVKSVHASLPRRERQLRLLRFRSGESPILTAVDLLNEGVDVPDVNILCFARVTHSRRIFVQQLGRGLRTQAGKERLEVLDFVSDIKRLAAVYTMRERVREDELETLSLPRNNRFVFTDQRVEGFIQEWLEDVADLEDTTDEARLNFPPMEEV